jgi:endonuclease/exonuclease/phosphatase family metal-dependent hydrolase
MDHPVKLEEKPMNSLFKFLVFGGFIITLATPSKAQRAGMPTMNVMSFNIRYDNPGDGDNRWEKRSNLVAQIIQLHGISLCGLQEALANQIEDLKGLMPGWAAVGVGRDDGKSGGEFSPIFYDTFRLELLQHHTFWLSTSPERPSTGWDAALPRIVTWAKFRHKISADTFFVFNTHFDHIGREARRESAKLIARKVEEISGIYPALIMGDINATPEEEPVQFLMRHFQDCKTLSKTPHFGPESTFNGFGPAEQENMRIDYIFLKGKAMQVLRHATLSHTWAGRFASDHHAVLVEFGW